MIITFPANNKKSFISSFDSQIESLDIEKGQKEKINKFRDALAALGSDKASYGITANIETSDKSFTIVHMSFSVSEPREVKETVDNTVTTSKQREELKKEVTEKKEEKK